MERRCPRCHVALQQRSHRGVQVDACERCHGYWLDAREVGTVTGRVGIAEWLQAAAHAAPPPVCLWCNQQQTRHGAACERCGGAMGAVCPACQVWMPVLEIKGVELDYCIRCGGLWLDAAEEVPELPPRPAPPPPAAPGPAAAAPAAPARRRPRYHAPVTAPPVAAAAPPAAGYRPPAGPAAAPSHAPTPIRLAPPQPHYPPPVAAAPVAYAPYWGPAAGYQPYGTGYWYNGYWYDPYAATAAGVAVGVGAAATAGAMYSLLDWGFDFW